MSKRFTPAELDARLKFVIGCLLGVVLLMTTGAILYALVFVTQPIGAQAENDKMFFGVLSSVATFITGTLAGLMIATGKGGNDDDGNGIPDSEEQNKHSIIYYFKIPIQGKSGKKFFRPNPFLKKLSNSGIIQLNYICPIACLLILGG